VADRYNVQAYPNLAAEAKRQNQKVIYGYEFDMLPKQISVVINPINQSLNDAEYIVFDIETTGLYNEYDEIIEFGGIKIKQGRTIETIDFFIKPSKPIPEHIIRLTNITNEQLDNAVPIKTALKQITD
jgi:DNA polymerase-3 subunit alpha (Gram-positive type)